MRKLKAIIKGQQKKTNKHIIDSSSGVLKRIPSDKEFHYANNDNNNCQAQPKWKGNTEIKQWTPCTEWPITC